MPGVVVRVRALAPELEVDLEEDFVVVGAEAEEE